MPTVAPTSTGGSSGATRRPCCAFDVLAADSTDLRDRPLGARKRVRRWLMPRIDSRLPSTLTVSTPEAVICSDRTALFNLYGIVAKWGRRTSAP